ncbi:hypothetical protein GCM10009555_097070 [Acrocarpospora macrocephala]|uniref:Uncharacterized protein n=1 Tax=Acrocarpospora macrocephala TaxID=150177 RepID=A0A5M3WT47_9ACTN|nr:hypothetical protein Amac_029440 [Acrocarpospora macrocephala]
MVSCGIAVPHSAAFSKDAGDGGFVVAEGIGDNGSGDLQELLPDGGAPGGGRGDADRVKEP